MSLYRLINGLEILRMPMGSGDGESFGDDASVAQEVFDAKLKSFNVEKERAKKEKEIADAMGDQLEAARQSIRIDDIKLNNAAKFITELEKQNKLTTEAGFSIDNLSEMFSLTAKQSKELADVMDKSSNIAQDMVAKIEEFRAKMALSTKFANKLDSAIGTIAGKMGIAANNADTMMGGLLEGLGLFLSGDIGKNLVSLASGIAGLVNPMNILSAAGKKAFEIFDKFNRKTVEIRKSTGRALENLQNELIGISSATAAFGVTLDQATTAVGSMQSKLIGIQSLEFANELAGSAAMMNQLGVTTDTTASNMNMLMKTFKDSTGNIIPGMNKSLEQMAVNAEKIGITAQKLATDFGENMKYLSIEGRTKGIKVFQDLAAQASVTGTAISSMLNMVKPFDKFSEGAKKAATLNAVLGTSLSSMALMTMDPAERMKELRKQVNMATGGVNNMTRAQKLFTAEAMGYASVQEMLADLQGDPAEMERRANLMQTQADIQTRLNNAMNDLVPVMDKVSRMFENFVRENPQAIQNIADAAMNLVEMLTYVVDNINGFAGAMTSLYIAVQIYAAKQAHSNFTVAQAAVVQAEAALQTELSAAARAKQNGIISTNTAIVHANSFAWAKNGIKITLAIGALLALYNMFHKRGSPMLYMMPLVMAGFVIILSRALETMSLKAMLGALALSVLAGGVALVFYGMASFVESLTGLFTAMSQSVDTMPAVILGIFALGGAFLFLGYAASLSSAGIFMGLGALTAMLVLFSLTGQSMGAMFGAGDEIAKIGNGIDKFGQGLNNIKSAVAEIKSSVGEKGLFAGSVSGDTSSLIMGDGVAIAKLFKNSKIEVDVKMPDISMPKVEVKVFIGNEQLKDIIRTEINRNKR